MIPSAIVLGLAAWVAALLARSRPSPPERVEDRHAAARVLGWATGVQAIHFAEELATGLNERLGSLFGVAGIPFMLFVAFNVAWLLIWVASMPGLRRGRPLAYFAAWFLAIAGMFNGILHPLLAVAADGYFPGVITSSFIGAISVWLWVRLRRATRAGPTPAEAA